MLNELTKAISKIAEKKETQYDLTFRTDGGMSEHAIGLKPVALKVYALTILAGIGKDRYPISAYDGDLQVILNRKKFFSTNMGLHFDTQKTRVLNDLSHKWGNGTFMFTDIYGLQKGTKFRPRLWSLNFALRNRELFGHATFGHCDLFPMLPYEILGATVIGEWMLKMTGMKVVNWSWYFHSITNKTVRELEQQPMFTKIPEPSEVFETLRLEEMIRNFKPKIPPFPNMALPKELDDFVKQLHEYWRNQK